MVRRDFVIVREFKFAFGDGSHSFHVIIQEQQTSHCNRKSRALAAQGRDSAGGVCEI
jgi:hypothetical protein